MKYKVGDKVKVRSYNSMKEQYGVSWDGSIPVRCTFVLNMKKFCEITVTISKVMSKSYRIREDRAKFYWSDDMLESPLNSIAYFLNHR